MILGRVSNIGSILRFPSKSRKSKDGGSNAKRQRAQTYDAVNEYRGGQSQKDTGNRKENEYDGPESSAATSRAQGGVDDDSNNSTTTSGEADSRQPLREAGNGRPPQRLDPQQLEKRQAEERDFIRQHDSSEAHVWYLIDVQWLQAWKCFVTRGGQMPGPIENSRLVDRQTGKPKQGLHAVNDYRGVNEEIWNFWLSRYGGGPTVRRGQLDLYAQELEEPVQQGSGGLPQGLPLPGAPPPASAATAGGRRPQGGSAAGSEATQQSSSSSRRGGMFSTLGSRGSSGTTSSARSHQQQSSQQVGGSGGGGSAAISSSVRGGEPRRPGHADASGRQPAPSESSAKVNLCCDKCDGPHETDKCPHFRKAREKHQDAWTSYGKSKKLQDADGDGAPIVRNARVITQPGDGSCLFHSLSYGLSNGSNAASLRREICGYIAKNPDMTIADTAIEEWIRYDSNDTVSQYAQRMAGGNWGGGIEMAALTKMKGVNVHVYEKCREGYKRISAFESPGARKTISVLYQGRMHYDAIVV
mmetsp:Transcript_50388/g.126933  ORF Transcript_50388/g.126933 Transcript_50388/m.126933 type:complete len:527 (-) Transcript_50388:57-1637(-)